MTGATCTVCGERIESPYALANLEDAALCPVCRRLEPPFAKAAAYGSYNGGLRELIHLLKYDRVRPAANVLGRMLSEVIADMAHLFAASEMAVVPVPLHASKRRQRGFNQAELIARAALKQKFQLRLVLHCGLLERCRPTESQIGLTRHQRRENMRGAFRVRNSAEIENREVLLVDDVFTTGTTASECARVLRRAGASRIYVATVARTLKAEAQGIEMPDFDEQTMAATG
jgi:ComF family protein